MARLTEEMVIARSKQSDLSAIKKLNCWGAELGDVSLLRRMPNVEVLAFSINKIRTLVDFAACRRLRELYVRKNEIRDLAEIRHLRRLPDLTSLWLDENPCTLHPGYRMTVLKNLPNLEKLDNVAVHPEEVQEAIRKGVHIPDSDDEGYPQQESFGRRQRSCESSPERDERAPHPHPHHPAPHRHDQWAGSDGSAEPEPQPEPEREPHQCAASRSPDADERYERYERYERPEPGAPAAMSASHYEARAPAADARAALRHSVSAHSVRVPEYGCGAGGEWRPAPSPPTPPSPPRELGGERADRSESYSAREWERDRERERERDREYPSAVMAEHRGFTRRPVARNSNLLSAVLCLVKELDYPSLEVAEMAVRCRMDELANTH